MLALKQVGLESVELIHAMQVHAFMPLYQKYRDDLTSPAMENVHKVAGRIADPLTRYFLIVSNDTPVGAIRVQQKEDVCRISPLFVLPEHQGRGIAQKAMQMAEKEYPFVRIWELATIQQEAGNCHLYEKMGYVRTNEETVINERMTIIGYRKLRKN